MFIFAKSTCSYYETLIHLFPLPLFLFHIFSLLQVFFFPLVQGNEVRATIYSNNIQAFEDTLQVAKTYLLSNATVKEAKAEYRKRDDELHWTINARTMIQELDESHDHVLQSVYNFSPLANIQSHMDKKTEISILYVIINSLIFDNNIFWPLIHLYPKYLTTFFYRYFGCCHWHSPQASCQHRLWNGCSSRISSRWWKVMTFLSYSVQWLIFL